MERERKKERERERETAKGIQKNFYYYSHSLKLLSMNLHIIYLKYQNYYEIPTNRI